MDFTNTIAKRVEALCPGDFVRMGGGHAAHDYWLVAVDPDADPAATPRKLRMHTLQGEVHPIGFNPDYTVEVLPEGVTPW